MLFEFAWNQIHATFTFTCSKMMWWWWRIHWRRFFNDNHYCIEERNLHWTFNTPKSAIQSTFSIPFTSITERRPSEVPKQWYTCFNVAFEQVVASQQSITNYLFLFSPTMLSLIAYKIELLHSLRSWCIVLKSYIALLGTQLWHQSESFSCIVFDDDSLLGKITLIAPLLNWPYVWETDFILIWASMQ